MYHCETDEADEYLEHSVKIISLIQHISDNVDNPPEALGQRLEHLGKLEVLARRVQEVVLLHETGTEPILLECNSHAEKLLSLLHEINVEGGQAQTWRDVCTAQKEEEMFELFSKLDQGKSELGSKIGAIIEESYKMTDKVPGYMLQPKRPTADSYRSRCGTFRIREAVYQQLFTTEIANDCAEIKEVKGDSVEGSWDWVLQRREFTEWEASERGLLWILGGPASGKTMLAVHLMERAQPPKEMWLYYFFDARLDNRNNAACLLKSLMFQINQLGRDPDDRCYWVGRRDTLTRLWSLLVEILKRAGDCRVVCVLDGLDECEPGSLEFVLSKLGAVISHFPIKFVLLSREHPENLERFLAQYPRIRLDAGTEGDSGLRKYIATRLMELPQMEQYSTELRNRTQKFLLRRSKGSYVWASLAIWSLRPIIASDVEVFLEDLPDGLGPLYKWLLRQANPEEWSFIRDVLRWCALSQKPMELSHLAEVLQIQAEGAVTPTQVLRQRLQHWEPVIEISKHPRRYVILQFNGKKETLIHGEYEAVTLVHRSLSSLLTDASSSGKWFTLYPPAAHHGKLAIKCFESVRSTDGQRDMTNGIDKSWHSFYEYARKCWSYHFQRSGEHAPGLVRDNPEYFVKSPWLEKWFESLEIRKSSIQWRLGVAAAALGMDSLVQHVVDAERTKMRLLKSKWLRGQAIKMLGTTPLHLAAKHGQLPIVGKLIDRIPIDLEDVEGYTPLFHAGAEGHLKAIEFLLKSGADGGQWPSPILRAIKQQNEAMVRMLLELSPDIFPSDLEAAAHNPMWIDGVQDSMAALLMPTYARQQAERCRRKEERARRRYVRLLPFEPSSQTWDPVSSILSSLVHGPTSLKTIESLLNLPGIILSSTDMGKSVRAALEYRDAAVLELLVREHGFLMPLTHAVSCLFCDTDNERALGKLRLLVEDYKADPNEFDGVFRDGTPLSKAIRRDNYAAVRYLVQECHVDPRGVCEREGFNKANTDKTAIEVATLLEKPEMVSLLLEMESQTSI